MWCSCPETVRLTPRVLNLSGALAQKKLMVLLCLGPVRGTLELQPYEDAEAYEVPTIPGLGKPWRGARIESPHVC